MPVCGSLSQPQGNHMNSRHLAIVPATWHVLWTYVLRRSNLPPPFLASFKLTQRCNLHCEPCPFWRQPTPDLPWGQVISSLAKLRQRGSRIVIFEGGEPLIWQDGAYRFKDVVAEARKLFLVVGATTNGTQPLDVGTDVLWVSLDGLQATHDRLRGTGVFQQALANIQANRTSCVYAHLTANRQNAAELPELIKFLRGKVQGITVQLYYPYGGKDNLWLPPDERERLLRQVIQLKQSGYPILNSIPGLRALMRGSWRCVDSLVDNVHPDGSLQQGCYLKGRDVPDCSCCGFSPHTEISLAYQGVPAAIWAGLRIFF